MGQNFRLDLHTHSIISYDGGLSAAEYEKILSDQNNFLAVTDHNEISFAQDLRQKLGQQVIVGEEILTKEGEVVGLFLNEKIAPHLSVIETIKQIKNQLGLVYIPHPLEKSRQGLPMPVLEQIKGSIDIVEVFNARAKEPWLYKQIENFAQKNNLSVAASSDAHSLSGIGSAFSKLPSAPTRENLIELLKQAILEKRRAPIGSLFAPLRNKLKKKFL